MPGAPSESGASPAREWRRARRTKSREKDDNPFHGFHGSGGGGKGFNRGQARVGNMLAKPRCIGGFDVNPASVRNFQRMTGVAGTVLDAFSREQYTAFHGKAPPAGWREATPQDIQRAAGGERPHIVFLSSPCKGLSGLLSASKSKAAKYIALNELTLRGVWLMLEAWGDDPPELMVLENVPGLLTRGRPLVDQITALLHAYGYAVAESVHDCGELGGLAQTRKRCLIVARHVAKVSAMLYEPPRRRLRAVGDVLQHLALPGDPGAGPMHRVPNLAWKTWVRLAFVQAGSDWRSLNRLAVQDGVLRDYLIVPCGQEGSGCYGVRLWSEPTGTVQGRSGPSNGAFSVADPRAGAAAAQYQQYGVRRWQDSSGAVTGQAAPGGGTFSVADPRCDGVRHNNAFRIVRYEESARAVTGGLGSVGGRVADPRPTAQGKLWTKYPVSAWSGSTGTVIAGDDCGAYAVADPRSGLDAGRGAYLTGGHYGVLPWSGTSGAVSSAACHDNGRWSLADPRMPSANEHLPALIVAEDGTWHRPFTTLELAALQNFFDPEDPVERMAFTLDGASDSAHREEIGNGVPPASAAAIASEMFRTLLLSWTGETVFLNDTDVWVRPAIAGLSLAQGQLA